MRGRPLPAAGEVSCAADRDSEGMDTEIALAARATAPAAASTAAPDRPSAVRPALCWTTVAAVLPYLTLKLIWLSGHPIGVLDRTGADSRALAALNTATLAMDTVAAFAALALTYRWGRRLPSWLVAPPLWFATGLLGALTLVVPAQVAWAAMNGRSAFTADFLRPWIYEMVYSGFIVQGICLLGAFALYSRARWPHLLSAPTAKPADDASAPRVLVALAPLTALTALPLLYWGFGGTAGLPAAEAAARAHTGNLLDLARGLAALCAALGVVSVLRRGVAGRALVSVWCGSAIIAAWGLWTGLMSLMNTPVSGSGRAAGLAQLPTALTGFGQALLGATLAVLTLRPATRRRAGVTGTAGPAKIEA